MKFGCRACAGGAADRLCLGISRQGYAKRDVIVLAVKDEYSNTEV